MADDGGSDTTAAAKPLTAAALLKKKSSPSSSSSSSIGKNSDDDTAPGGDDVDSQLTRSPAGIGNMDAWEDALPIPKGLSSHHGGRTKSYRDIADAAGDSSIVKPADRYSKKRKNKVARKLLTRKMGQGPMNKKPTTASRSTAPLSINDTPGSVTSSSQDDKSGSSDDDDDSSSSEEEIPRTTETRDTDAQG